MTMKEISSSYAALAQKGDARLEAAVLSLSSTAPLIVYGAGSAGRAVKNLLQSHNRIVSFFTDSNSALWNTVVDEVPVISPNDISKKSGATVVVAAWDRDGISVNLKKAGVLAAEFDIYNMLNGMSARSAFGAHMDKLQEVEVMLADQRSKETLQSLVLHAFTLDQALLDSIFTADQYFYGEPFTLSTQDTFIVVGAFEGDTVEYIASRFKKFGTIHCFEPNAMNFAKLTSLISNRGLEKNVVAHNQGLSDRYEKVSFAGTGSGFHKSTTPTDEVCELVSFDEAYPEIVPTSIKMDIEAAEPLALSGMKETIKKHKPRLAICVYHEPHHLWEIPLYIKSLVPEYTFSIRHHTRTRLETVVYAH